MQRNDTPTQTHTHIRIYTLTTLEIIGIRKAGKDVRTNLSQCQTPLNPLKSCFINNRHTYM